MHLMVNSHCYSMVVCKTHQFEIVPDMSAKMHETDHTTAFSVATPAKSYYHEQGNCNVHFKGIIPGISSQGSDSICCFRKLPVVADDTC